MNKTQEELNQIKEEYKTVTTKLRDLSEEELKVVTGAGKSRTVVYCKNCGTTIVDIFNEHEIPVDVPDRPCYRCGSRDFGIKKIY